MSQPKPPTEVVYVPEQSWLPILAAAGLTFLIIGLYAWWPISVAGGAVLLLSVKAWLSTNKADIAHMPREQHTDTAAVPLTAVETRE